MWPNAPQVELHLARLHIDDLLREAERDRRCPKSPAAFNRILAFQLRRLAGWLAPVRPSFDLLTPTISEPSN